MARPIRRTPRPDARLKLALARAFAADFPGAVKALLPAAKLPKDMSALYGFCGEQDLTTGPPGPWLTAGSVKVLRRRLAGAPRDGAALVLAAGELFAGRPDAAARRLEGAPGGAAAFLRAAARWGVSDRMRALDQLPAALDDIDAALAAFGPRADALILRAQILRECERNEETLVDLRAALRLNPEDWRTRLGVVETLTDMSLYAPALKELALVEKARGRRWWILAQRGRLKGLAGRREEAVSDFTGALALNPKTGGVHAWMAEALRGLGRLAQARAALDRAAVLDPGYAFTFELRGRLRLTGGDIEGALRDLHRACGLAPSRRLAFAWRGEALWKLGRAREAFADFERVAPLRMDTLWNPGTGKTEPVAARAAALRADLAPGARTPAGDLWAALTRGGLALWSGRPGESLEDLSSAARASDGGLKARALVLRAEAWSRLHDGSKALADLTAALALRPRDVRARAARARLLAESGRVRAARAEYDAALKRPDPSLAAAYAERGALRAAAGDGAGAASDARMAAAFGTKTAGMRG